MRISDWSSDVCSSDLVAIFIQQLGIIGNKREAGDIAFEANVFVSGLMIEMDRAHGLLRMTSRSSAVVEGAHAKTLKPQALHVDIGVEDVALVTETFRLGEFVAELVDHALAVPGRSAERRVGKAWVSTCRTRW